MSIGTGTSIDAAISTLLLETVAPAAIEVAVAVQGEIAERIRQADALRHQQLERARYDAELARRRCLKVDPDNRLVADALEADWNDRLRTLDCLQQEHEHQRHADSQMLTEGARGGIMDLAKDFPSIWTDPRQRALAVLANPSRVHPCYYPSGMRLAHVCVTADHSQRLVPQHFCDLSQRRAVHRQVGRARMPQIMEPEVRYPGFPECKLRSYPNVGGLSPRAPWEYKASIKSLSFRPFTH